MANGWVKQFTKPHNTVNCPSCNRAASFNHLYTPDSTGLRGIEAYCSYCSTSQYYIITTDYRQALDYGEYVAQVDDPKKKEKNPGEGKSKFLRRLGNYTPDYTRTELHNGEDKRDWFRRILS